MRSSGNRCWQCRYVDVCHYYKTMIKTLNNFEQQLVFNEISTTDKPKDEIINLLSKWCYYFYKGE